MRAASPTPWKALARALLLVALLHSGAAALPAHQAEGAVEEGEAGVRATLLVDLEEGATSGRVGVLFELAPGWHLYWRNPGDTGLAPVIRFGAETAREQDAVHFGEVAWPVPRAFREDVDLLTFGYEGSVLLAAPLALAGTAAPAAVTAHADVLVCADQCVPATLTMRKEAVGPAEAEVRTRFEAAARRVPAQAREHGVAATLEWPPAALAPGDRFEAALHVSPCEGAGDCALAAPSDATAAFYPYAPQQALLYTRRIELGRDRYRIALRGEALEPVPEDAAVRGVITLRGADGDRAFEIALPLAHARTAAKEAGAGAGVDGGSLLHALLFGLVGGLLLNLMPCVLPVLAIKICAVAEMGQQGRREILSHALAYAAGILCTLSLLAVAVVALRWSGTAVGWGFHLQEPLFVAVVAAVVVVFAINLLGAFEFELGTGGLAELGAGAVGARRSFFDGLLAVILATPCSAPFLGTAIGFAFASPAPVIVAIFLSIGLGLASPFLLVAAVPGASRWIPRSGPWMLELRRGLAFALLATAAWLVWIIGRTAGIDAMTAVLFLLLGVAFTGWCFGLVQRRRRAPGVLLVMAVTALLVGGLGRVELAPAPAEPPPPAVEGPRPWSPAALDLALDRGRPVFVYFTADWCLTCKVNESRVLADPQVTDALSRNGYEVLRADWTRRDPAIRDELARLGKAGVPVYALYAPGRRDAPRLMPELLRREPFLNAIAETAEESRTTATR